MASSSDKLKDKDFQNWLKVALGVSIARKGIEPYVSSVIEKFHSDALKDILSVEELDKNAVICTCDTEIFRKCSKCPRNICNKFKDKILIKHYHKNPSWKNTCVENWYRCPWEIAKCYMPPDGYRSVKSASETDMNGILSVMMNHMEFDITYRDICEEARDVTKKVRHSSDLSMSDQMLNDYLDILINFLETYKEKHQSAVDALENLKKLKEEKLQISTDDIIDVLKANVVEEIKRERNECLQNIIKEINLHHSVKSESLDKILNAKLKEVLTSIDEAKASTLDEIRRKSDSFKESPNITNYETLKHELKEDVLIFNKAHYSTIPLSPLFEKEDTPFKEMYVSPEMKIVEYPLRESLRADIKTNVTCLSDILKNKIDNIYVTSKAGLGKTIFCKRLVIAWYHAHKRDTFKDSFETVEDLNLLKTFDYAFLVLLREARATDCDIDTMIFDQIISHLGRSGRYTLDFLQDILTKERCLIILDGLDEWTHPKQKKCKTQNDIPHRNAREHCTILTTTRTWKFCLLSLSINEIDRLVQITGLDDNASEQLVNNTVSNFSSDVKCKNIQDFQHHLQKESLNKLKNVPLILIHLICLWYKNNTIGNSFCEIFCNIIGLHLQRAKHKLHLDECSDPKTTKEILPECITKNTHCKSSQELLMSLAKLAFNSYFDQNRENSLVFDVNMAKQYLHQDFDFCMATGLLTQTKRTRTKSVDLIEGLAPRISFAHKTFQEYFAALYMYIDDGVDIKVRTVINICSTVEDILAVTNFFIFLSGMCPDKANLLFPALCRIIRNSETVKDYRSDMGSWNYFVGYSETIKRLQTLFVNCMIESRDNGHNPEIVNFEDLIIDSDFRSEDYSTVLKFIMKHNTRNIKSVKLREVRTQNDFKEIVQLLRTNDRNDRLSLEKLDLKCEISDESLDLVLKDSEHSLKCFILKGGQWLGNVWSDKNVSLSNRNLQFIWSMNQLEGLYLRTMEMTHGQLENLLAFVSESYNMKNIGLGFIKCKKHDESCNDLKLNLANHSKLRMLEIGSVPLSKIRVNTQMLEVCYVGNFTKSTVLFELLSFLSHAPKLHVFVCGFLKYQKDIKKMLETIGKLKMLQRSWLVNMEIGNNEFRLCNDMKEIKELFLMNIQMSSETFHKLVEAVKAIRKTVIVGLSGCTVEPREDFESEKQSIKSTHTIYVIQDEVKDRQRKEFIFKTLVD